MRLNLPDYVVLIVEDLDITLNFYTEVLGLKLKHRSGDYAQMDTGATRLGFYTRSAMAKTLGKTLRPPTDDAPGFEIGFKVADVDAAYNELVKKGASPMVAPTTRHWGQRSAYVSDPDGHLIELAQDLGAKKGS
ncbi:VOC family protein [Desulfobacterota bacterium AH_259_B03_O07]|nr:VOC family protein [Desulfobacterota bacterium AH_259_B03_O07]